MAAVNISAEAIEQFPGDKPIFFCCHGHGLVQLFHTPATARSILGFRQARILEIDDLAKVPARRALSLPSVLPIKACHPRGYL
jgi:hypothetical protein